MDEQLKVVVATMKDFRDNREALKQELLRKLIEGCPHDICFSLEEYDTQEDIKRYLQEMSDCPADVFSVLFSRGSFFNTVQAVLGGKMFILSSATVGWLAQIDAAINAFLTLPFERESLNWSGIPDDPLPNGDEMTG